MTAPTKAQRTMENLNRCVMLAEDQGTISEALTLLHRVQSGELKALAREQKPQRQSVQFDKIIVQNALNFAEQIGRGWCSFDIREPQHGFYLYWDAAPAKPDSDGA